MLIYDPSFNTHMPLKKRNLPFAYLVNHERIEGKGGTMIFSTHMPISLVVRIMQLHQENKQLTQRVNELEDGLAARKIIEKAKGILMVKEGIQEAEAYRRLRTKAMNSRKTIKEISIQILYNQSNTNYVIDQVKV
ncbi:ANTAR domain-containing protein [Hazenella sp. IB182353]|nr:ANTAR domain-containing protein [Polycladospora coralii]